MVDLTQPESTQVAFGLPATGETHSFVHRRPLPRRMNQGQDPSRIAVDLVDQTVVLVRDQLQCARNHPLPADPRVIRQRGNRLAEPLVHPGGRLWALGSDVVPDVDAVL